MKHDYEAAINQRYLSDDEAWVRDYGDIIEHALKLAAKVTGEPSEKMIELGFRKFQGFAKPWNAMCNGFREMIAQAQREIEG